MSELTNNEYCNIPFTTEMSKDDFYTHARLPDLISICEMDKENITKIRTIGIMESINGRFFIKDLDSANKTDASNILVSMSYVKSSLPSPVIPYTVQIFGTMQWKNRPVIFAKIVQVLNTTSAIQLSNAMQSIYSRHLASQ
ncbi:unnamed protein product [Euphydryas editha]|uniref:Uncharacterized protein n=1 Tax=Euphydryas editha TaxID=104508 RepID=A0AAU9UN76_EUPED|nr:unnamed protein product [Euphydryas editha]